MEVSSWASMIPWLASWAHCLSIGAVPGMPRATTSSQLLLDQHLRATARSLNPGTVRRSTSNWCRGRGTRRARRSPRPHVVAGEARVDHARFGPCRRTIPAGRPPARRRAGPARRRSGTAAMDPPPPGGRESGPWSPRPATRPPATRGSAPLDSRVVGGPDAARRLAWVHPDGGLRRRSAADHRASRGALADRRLRPPLPRRTSSLWVTRSATACPEARRRARRAARPGGPLDAA